MEIERLYQILQATTVQLRKGQTVEHEGNVTHIYAMPHESEAQDDIQKVDCHFIVVGVNKAKAEQCKEAVVSILEGYPEPGRLAGGPSYIEVGGIIGDQGMALQLFALGKVLQLWDIITPLSLGFTGSEADELAGGGLVMITGFETETLRRSGDTATETH